MSNHLPSRDRALSLLRNQAVLNKVLVAQMREIHGLARGARWWRFVGNWRALCAIRAATMDMKPR